MHVRSFVDRSYPFVNPLDLLTNARALLRDIGLRVLPVVNREKKLEGVVTRAQVLVLSSTRSNALVRDVMDNPKLVFGLNEDARLAFKTMIELDEWYAPVINKSTGKYIGMLALETFLKRIFNQYHSLHGASIDRFMTKDVLFFTPEDYVNKVWRKMQITGYSGFPVVNGSKKYVVGMITQHDLLRKGYTRVELESESGPKSGPKVKEAMTSPAVTVKPYTTLKEAILLMVKNDIGRLPVVDDSGKLIGVIDRSDIVKAYLNENYTQSLRDVNG